MLSLVARQVFVTGAVFCAVTGAAAQSAAAVPRRVQVRGVVDGTTLLQTARGYLGVRYQFGGTTPRAFDCSGFVRYVFAQHGLAVPRTAHEQSALGRTPDPGDLRPGDLLFFYGGDGAQHIAIYAGEDSIIHASSTGRRVKMDKLAGVGTRRSWFGQRLIAVRRVLPAEGLFYLPGSLAALSLMDSAPQDDPFAPTPSPLY
jgi:cell wall-associated NlpC family hydrolase